MPVIAFVDSSRWDTSVLEHAAWVAKATEQAMTVVAQEETPEREPAIAYDAYQQMNAREDMFRELAAQSHADYPETDKAAIEIAQKSARKAKDLGVERVRTVTNSDLLPYFVENFTDSGDLLVVARRDNPESQSRQWLDRFLKIRGRMILMVPEDYAPVESWMIAIDGKPATGRAVDFLSGRKLLAGKPGTAIFVGNDYQNRIHFRDAVRHLRGCDHSVQSHELQGNADDVLAAVLAVSPVDLLVMGAYGQGRFRLLNEGSTTSRLLKTFRGPVLAARA